VKTKSRAELACLRELNTNNKDAEITVAAGVDQRTRTKEKISRSLAILFLWVG
jgi:hypothetical protein